MKILPADEYHCPDCDWSGSREDLLHYSDSSEFWGETVRQVTVDTTTCPACRGDSLEDLEEHWKEKDNED